MSDIRKPHQSNRSEYQIRVDGKPVRYYSLLCEETIISYLQICKENQDCYVDICRVSHEIIMNQGCYHVMKRHYEKENNNEKNT